MDQKIKKKSKIKWVVIGLIAILIGLGVYVNHLRNVNKSFEYTAKLDKAYSESIKETYDKKEKAIEFSKSALVADNETLNIYLKEKDKELYDLKKDKKAAVGAIFKDVLRIDTVVKTFVTDTSADIRTAKIVNDHYEVDVLSTRDSTSVRLSATDKIKFSLGDDSRVRITHSNPYIRTEELNSFYVKPQNKSNWKIYAGFAAGIVAGHYLHK